MEKFYVRFADRNIAVSANYLSTRKFCENYLVDIALFEVDIEINISFDDIDRERKFAKNVNIDWATEEQLEIFTLHRKVSEALTQFQTVLFHGSAIAVDGEVYLFTAPSGTGKSTHTRLWRERFGERAIMVNDDKPFLHLKENGSIVVYGSPWDGKHGLSSNVGLPLKAICILEQAQENHIEKVSGKDGLESIYLQTFWSKTNQTTIENSLHVFAGMLSYPLWRLRCNISKEAVKVSYEAMSGKQMEE